MLNLHLLWFLPLALVPVVMHLFSLRRTRTVDLSTFRFLMESYIQQRRKVKLLEFLLMALRTLFVLLIILALSRPVIERFAFLFKGQGGQSVILIMDTGASMALRSGATTSFERASGAARTLLAQLGDEDHITLIAAGQYAQIVEQRFAGRSEAILQALDAMRPGSSTSDIGAALATALEGPRRGARIIYVITDGNRKTWAGIGNHPALQKLDSDDRLVVMNVGTVATVQNLAATGDPPSSLCPVVGLPVALQASVMNSSGLETAETVLTVTIDGKEQSRINLSLRPGERATRPISFTPRHAGIIRGTFALPADAFPADDTFLFCLNVQEGLTVAVVAPPAASDAAAGARLFLRAALESPRKADHLLSAADRQLAAALTVTELAAADVTLAALLPADLVILADPNLKADARAALRRYVESGGGLLLLPGAGTTPDLCAELFTGAGAGTAEPALRLGDPVGDPDDESTFQTVSGLTLSHPVLRIFDEPDADFFDTVRVYRHFPIVWSRAANASDADAAPVTNTAPAVSTLLHLPDHTPLLVETRIGLGRVLLAGIPATPDWSNLPLKPEFVPLLLRAVAYLRRAAEVQVDPNILPHRPAVIRVSDLWPDAHVQAFTPDGKPHTIALRRSGSRRVGALTDTADKGYYRVQVAPRTTGAPDQLELGFAVNLDTRDAEIVRQGKAEILDALAPAEAIYLEGQPDDPLLKAQLTQRREIWRSLIWIMFLVMGVEFLLSTLRVQRREAGTGPRAAARRWLRETVGTA